MHAREVVTQLFLALERGEEAHASRLLAPLAAARPEDPNIRLAGAILARLQGDLAASIERLRRLRDGFPRLGSVALQLGLSLQADGQQGRARREFARGRSLAHGPSARAFAAACEAIGPGIAGPAHVAVNLLDPHDVDALHRALRCARRVPAPAQPAPRAQDADRYSVIVCSRTPERLERLARNLRERLGPHEFLPVHDPPSLAAGYSAALERATGEFAILCHADIRTLAPDFRARLRAALATADIVGVAGSTSLAGPAVFWAGPPHVHGWVIHRDGETFRPGVSSAFGPVIRGARLLDGLFLAGRTRDLRAIGFDPATFDGFHFYDLDFSLRAQAAGRSLAICPELLIEHLSRGRFDAAWRHYAERFVAKYGLPHRAPARSTTAEIAVGSEREVQAVYAAFADWTRPWIAGDGSVSAAD